MWRNSIRSLFLGAALLVAALFSPAPASAACAGGTCFAIATGNWGTSGSWSILSGGVSCVCTPATGDAIVLDANSGNITSTMEAAYSIASLVTTGFTGTLTQNAFTLTVSGNTFTLVAGMTYTPSASTRLITFTSTSGTTAITTAGKTLGALTFNGVAGTFQLQDALNYRSDGTMTLTNGTFDANNQNVTGGLIASSNANARTFTGGSGTYTLTGTGSILDFTTSTNLTNPTTAFSSATVTATVTSVASRLMAFGAASTIGTLNVSANTSGADFQLSAGSSTTLTVTTLNVTAPNRIFLAGSGARIYAFTNGFTFTGSSGSEIGISNTANSTFPTVTSANTMGGTWAAFAGLTFAGGGNLTATNSFDLGGVTISGGGTKSITAPATGGGGRIIGG